MSFPRSIPDVSSSGLQVVVVESDWITRRAAEKTLELLGARVTCLESESALSALAAHLEHGHIDLAFVSLAPSVTEAAQLARTISMATDAAVVYMADTWDDAFDELTDPEPAGFLMKPYQEAHFAASVSVAKRRRAARPLARELHDSPRPTTTDGDADSVGRARRDTAIALAAGLGAKTESTQRLTVRELQVVHLLMTGSRVRAISDILSLSPHTVRNHLKSIYRKPGRAQSVRSHPSTDRVSPDQDVPASGRGRLLSASVRSSPPSP